MAPPTQNRRILNVDDHAPARFLRTRILQRAGYTVDEADTAADALERAGDAALLLLDVKLPDADGFTVCEQVKARHPKLPVIMVTSVFRTAQARRDAFSVGADAYLLDPVEPERLIRTVQTFVGDAQPAPEAAVDLAWIITNAIGQIEDLSDSAAKLLNLSRRGAMGRTLPTFFTDNRPGLMAELLRASEGVLIDRSMTLQPRDRRARRVHVDVAVMMGQPGERVQLRWTLHEQRAAAG